MSQSYKYFITRVKATGHSPKEVTDYYFSTIKNGNGGWETKLDFVRSYTDSKQSSYSNQKGKMANKYINQQYKTSSHTAGVGKAFVKN